MSVYIYIYISFFISSAESMNNAGQTLALSVCRAAIRTLCGLGRGNQRAKRAGRSAELCRRVNRPWDSHGLLLSVGMPGRTGPGRRGRGCGDGALGFPPAARLSPAPPPQPGAAAFPPPAVAVATGGCSRGAGSKMAPPGLGGPGPGDGT